MKHKLRDASDEDIPLKVGDEVDLSIMDETPMGFKAKINGEKEGLLFRNEVFEPTHKGDYKRGYIKNIREDGKIDLTLYKPGYEQVRDVKYLILDAIKKHNGRLPLGDKSEAAQVQAMLHISKKVFKKAIGALYKSRLVLVSDYETRLSAEQPE